MLYIVFLHYFCHQNTDNSTALRYTRHNGALCTVPTSTCTASDSSTIIRLLDKYVEYCCIQVHPNTHTHTHLHVYQTMYHIPH